MINFITEHETTEVYNSRIMIKEGLHFQCQVFLQSITLSTQRLWIFYWTGFT